MYNNLEDILNGYFNDTTYHFRPMFKKNGDLSVLGNHCYNKMTDCLQDLNRHFINLDCAICFLQSLKNLGINDNDDFLSIVDTCDKITHEKE